MGRFERGMAKLDVNLENVSTAEDFADGKIRTRVTFTPSEHEQLFVTKPIVVLDDSGLLTLDELVAMDADQ